MLSFAKALTVCKYSDTKYGNRYYDVKLTVSIKDSDNTRRFG